MAKKLNPILIIGILLVVIFFLPQQTFLGSISELDFNSIQDCENYQVGRCDDPDDFCTECTQLSIGDVNCYNYWTSTLGYGGGFSPQEGEWTFIRCTSNDCDNIYWQSGHSSEVLYKCAYTGELEAPDQCIDSDNGRNYDIAGFVQNTITGSISYDFCFDSNTLREGYCEDGQVRNVIVNCNCVGEFTNQRCDGPINTCAPGDADCNGVVDRAELGQAILNYLTASMSRVELGQAIQLWVSA